MPELPPVEQTFEADVEPYVRELQEAILWAQRWARENEGLSDTTDRLAQVIQKVGDVDFEKARQQTAFLTAEWRDLLGVGDTFLAAASRISQAMNEDAEAAGKFATEQEMLDETLRQGTASLSDLVTWYRQLIRAQGDEQQISNALQILFQNMIAANKETTDGLQRQTKAADDANGALEQYRKNLQDIGKSQFVDWGEFISGITQADANLQRYREILQGVFGTQQTEIALTMSWWDRLAQTISGVIARLRAYITAARDATEAGIASSRGGGGGAGDGGGGIAPFIGPGARGFGGLGFLFGGGTIAGINALHLAIDLLIEAIISIGTAAAAAMVGIAALSGGFADIKDHATAVMDVNHALGNQIPGLSQQFINLQHAFAPGAINIYGGALNLIHNGLSSIKPIITEVVGLFETWIARIDIWAKNSGILNKLLQDGVGFLGQFASIVGHLGDALKNLLGAMPGVAHWWLDIFEAVAKVIDVLTKIPRPILSAVIAIHGLYLIVRVLAGAFTTLFGGLYAGLARLATNPLAWVAGAAIAVAYLAHQASEASSSIRNMIAGMEFKLNTASASQAIVLLTGDVTTLQQRLAELKAHPPTDFLQNLTAAFTPSSSWSEAWGKIVTSFKSFVSGGQNPISIFGTSYSNNLSTINNEINKMIGAHRNLLNELGQLHSRGNSWTQSLALMDLAGVKWNDSVAVMNQKVQNLIQGYTALGVRGGMLANSVNAITFATDQQDSKVGTLTQSWSTFFNTVAGGAQGFTSFAQALGGNLTTALRSTGGQTERIIRTEQGLAQAIATAHGNMTGLTNASISAQAQFIQTAQAGQTEMNNLTMLASAAGQGAKGTAQLAQASKDMVATMLPAAQHSKTLTTVLYALAQQGGYRGADSFQALSKWVGDTEHPMRNLQGIVTNLTVAAGNLTTDVKNLSNALGQDLNQAMSQAIFFASGGQKAFNDFAQALMHTSINSGQTRTAAQNLMAQMIELTGNTTTAHREFDTFAMQLGLTKKQADALWASNLKLAESIADLHDKHLHLTETATGTFNIMGMAGPGNLQGPGGQRRAAGGLVTGPGTPTSDSIPARLSAGEYVVRAGAVAHYGKQMMDAINTRNFAQGGMVQHYAEGGAAGLAQQVQQFDTNFTNAATRALENAMRSAMSAAISSAQAQFATPSGIKGGGNVFATMMQIARSIGWGAYAGSWWNVIMRESGGNMFAQNPSSGAYGIAQFINGPGEYYQYGGNPNTVVGQLIAMANYIRQRYGNPAGAWASELSRGWYDGGGYLPTGLSLALNTTGRPEPVGNPGVIHSNINVFLDGKQIWSAVQQENLRYNVRNSGSQQSGVLAPSFGKTIFSKANQ